LNATWASVTAWGVASTGRPEMMRPNMLGGVAVISVPCLLKDSIEIFDEVKKRLMSLDLMSAIHSIARQCRRLFKNVPACIGNPSAFWVVLHKCTTFERSAAAPIGPWNEEVPPHECLSSHLCLNASGLQSSVIARLSLSKT
jgi:hypothetical protein